MNIAIWSIFIDLIVATGSNAAAITAIAPYLFGDATAKSAYTTMLAETSPVNIVSANAAVAAQAWNVRALPYLHNSGSAYFAASPS